VIEIRPVADDREARAAATIMATSEPWITLGRTFERCLATLHDEALERYVAVDAGEVIGFVLLTMRGTFTGYIKSIAVRADARSHGIGARLIAFAEERIFRESPNVFLCVSGFNDRAKTFYMRHGYEVVGPLRDFVIRGSDEILLRKTIAPLTGWQPRA
jgi:ribosomal protein S18 acetylase RimI-like enzyme